MPRLPHVLHCALLAALLCGCAAAPSSAAPGMAPTAAQLPLHQAWFEGRLVHYITTDVSDADLARAKGANFVPRLKELLPPPGSDTRRLGIALERVYGVVNSTQPTVFPSTPRPVGAGSVDTAYSPLWRLVQVAWLPGRTVVELKSEEAVLQAEERGDVTVTLTNVVLNCAVVAVAGDAALPGVRLLP